MDSADSAPPLHRTPVFLLGLGERLTERIEQTLRQAGMSRVTPLGGDKPLESLLYQLAQQGDELPALVLLDEAALPLAPSLAQRLRQLSEAGRLALIQLGHTIQPATAEEAGYLDAIRIDADSDCDDDLGRRLLMAIQLLHERRLRLAQQKAFRARLAQHRITEARLNYLAAHDELTDLPNRQSFESALDKALLLGARRQLPHALLFLDLDRFKLHNDAAGHGSGNHLLRTVANRLRSALPAEYPLARIGSDEFAVLLEGADESEATRTAEQLRRQVAGIEPDAEQIVYHVAASIGLTLIPPGTTSGASQALARAEQACYVAKTRGGNAVHTFSQEDDILHHLREDMHWAQPIRQALADDQLFLAYQPILDVRTNRIDHYEALVRIPQQLGGDDQSARFMLAAERLGLARQVDLWVVDKAIDYLAASANTTLSLGVNLSSHAFQERELLPRLQRKIESAGIDPTRLTFEITETSAIMNFADTRRMVHALRELGCRFALDDFGSGFSTYHYIKQFPIDVLKIDGSFIVNITRDREDRAIVQSMIEIAHSLGKEVVVEFIEDAETLELLIQMGMDHAQGFYIGKPTVNPAIQPAANDKEPPA
ncbi:MAG: putative bifunctional diguanylate cyclase/phosphodiesterase [Pseudomonadota bacterium]